jgi:hypothetical protein
MSLQVLAQDMASRGRGPDTMLVHMAPKEVAGLQALALAHGGSLTVNPQTGLPEAGFLKNLLPTLIGAGLMFATGGTGAALIPGLSNAATIGLGVGGIQALRTGSLRKGLMAGLGAYGGAGMMGSVLGAGTGAISAGAAPVSDAGTMVAQAPATAGVTEFTGVAAAPTTAVPPATSGLLTPDAGHLFAGPPPVAPVVAPPVTAAYPPINFSGQAATLADEAAQRSVINKLATTTPMDTAKAGIKAIADKPGSFLTKDNLKYGASALAPMMFAEPKNVEAPRDTEQFRYAYDPGRAMPPTRVGDVGEFTYYRPSYTRLAADGGLMDLPVERMSDRNDAMMGMANGGQMYAAGGLSHLGDYSDGGRLLRGPGDGVSDNIPATIANKRPARLADGEFVVPARIVSELGNGSTEAGARKLYAMMDRVQKNRNKTVGKGRVAVDSRSEKLLPA